MSSKKRGELFRDTEHGKIAGVCAGISDFFGWETWLVRIFFVSALILGSPIVMVIYVAAWFILDKKIDHEESKMHANASDKQTTFGQSQAKTTDESIKVKSRIWQKGEPPKQAFHDIHRKFKRLESKLISIERYVTSSEFTISREINKL